MMKRQKLLLSLLLILYCLFIADMLFSIGIPSGTTFTTIKKYSDFYQLPNNYKASNLGELVVTFTNANGYTNAINGYFLNSLLQTNITTMTVSAGYDLSSIPLLYSANGSPGGYIDYVFLITNKANISDNLYLRVLPIATDESNWNGNFLSLFINGSSYGATLTNIFTNRSASADEQLNVRVRLEVPDGIPNFSTNLISMEIWNSVGGTNTGIGDNWPGAFAFLPATPDTNNQRDYQKCYLKTTAFGYYHTVSIESADDMIHTIYKFDGTEQLGTTRIKINIILDSPPVDKGTFYLIYNINEVPAGNGDVKIEIEGDGLHYYALIFAKNDKRIKNGVQLNFMIALDGANYYRNGKNGVIPWSFKLRDIKMQRNNISILRNLLNPRKGEKTILFYSLSKPSIVHIEVYTLSGEKITTLFDGYQQAGLQNPIYWDGTNEHGAEVGEGLYFLNIRTDEINEIRKVIVVK